MGDVNLDSKVNLQDVIILLNYLKGTRTLEGNGLLAAKVKGNSNVRIRRCNFNIKLFKRKCSTSNRKSNRNTYSRCTY
jgi:hypothetical protein